MISSFASVATEKLFACERVPKFTNIEVVALRKLAMLHRAVRVEELRIPPSNRLEVLKGNRAGTYSIRINDQFRLCFRFDNGEATDVEIVDYH
jgi:proteic killer suppression protein